MSVADDGTADATSAEATTSGDGGTSTGEPPGTGSDSGGNVGGCGGFAAVEDFAEPGPFETMDAAEGPDCTIFRPVTLGEGGLRHP